MSSEIQSFKDDEFPKKSEFPLFSWTENTKESQKKCPKPRGIFVYELSPLPKTSTHSILYTLICYTKLHLRKLLEFLFLYSKIIFDTMFHPTLAEFNLNSSIKVYQIRTTSDLIQCRKHVWKWKIRNLTIFVGVVLYDKCVYTI